jgi:hypothetical protein
MRVIGEYNGSAVTSCSTPRYGQVEDYSVIILPRTLSTKGVNMIENNTTISQSENTVQIKSDIKITAITIYDASGRMLINQTNIRSTEIEVPINAKNIVVTVRATLENGKVITQKLRF